MTVYLNVHVCVHIPPLSHTCMCIVHILDCVCAELPVAPKAEKSGLGGFARFFTKTALKVTEIELDVVSLSSSHLVVLLWP